MELFSLSVAWVGSKKPHVQYVAHGELDNLPGGSCLTVFYQANVLLGWLCCTCHHCQGEGAFLKPFPEEPDPWFSWPY